MNAQSIISQTTPAHEFIISQTQGEEIITSLPYSEAIELARLIISQSSEPELKFMVRNDIYEMFEFEGKYEVRVTYRSPLTQSVVRHYSTFLGALSELQRVYHEAVGWANGLDPLFVPENDHQANGQRDAQEHEIRSCANIEDSYYTTRF